MKYDADWQHRLRAIQPAGCSNGHSFLTGGFEVTTRDEQAAYTCSQCDDRQTFDLPDSAESIAHHARSRGGFRRGQPDLG